LSAAGLFVEIKMEPKLLFQGITINKFCQEYFKMILQMKLNRGRKDNKLVMMTQKSVIFILIFLSVFRTGEAFAFSKFRPHKG